jgi:hypothetical protein
MMINRRTFVAGAVVMTVSPPPDMQAPPAVGSSRVVFLVDGWSVPSDDETAERMWFRIDRGWRAAWR